MELSSSLEGQLDIQQFTEPCMHQLFLGIQKIFIFLIQEWSTLHGKYESLRKILEKLTRQVENIHLSWIKMQPYIGEKLDGWVSENYLAFSHLLPWLYKDISVVAKDNIISWDIEKPVGNWSTVECKQFLRQ